MSSKRKAAQAPAAATNADGATSQSAKRRKVSSPAQESAESTTETGLRCLERIKAARDKSDRSIATHFLTLPDKKLIPQYYQEVGLPISLDIIEKKLKTHEYPTITTVESDLRRMISNAKSFNEKSSEIFSDAEKVRKAVSNFMVDNNPAYGSKQYKPFPTPVPDDWQDRLPQDEAEEEDGEAEEDEDTKQEEDEEPAVDVKDETKHATRGMRKRRASSAAIAPSNRHASGTPAVQATEGLGQSFENDTFQKAQEKIVAEMLDLKNNNDKLIAGPFTNLPSRELRDYYRVIKHPVSLRSVQKAVQGVKGREKPTGVSNFKSWATFEDETSAIWKNAYHYNEDGSEISEAARLLEKYFYRRLNEAKKVVAEPPQPKVKLRMPAKSPEPPKITLKFGGTKPSIAGGVSVDNEALRRQQDLVNAGMNGGASIRPGPKGPQVPNGIPPLPKPSQEPTRSASAEKPALNGVKSETSVGQSPALAAVQMNTNRNGSLEARQSPNPSMMPPPMANLTTRLPSGSPHPQSYAASSQYNPPTTTNYSSTSQFDSSRRQAGKEPLLINLSLSTHPGLKIPHHFHLDVPPSPKSTHQSLNIFLPSTHYYLQLSPTLSQHTLNRPHKVFLTVNNNRVGVKSDGVKEKKEVYEHRIMPGMNRIEVEVVAGWVRGAPKVGQGPEVEVEKITVYASLGKG